MATSPNITRRSVLATLGGAVASTAALAVPAIAAVAVPKAEDPYDRARRLGKELAQALSDIENHPLAPDQLVAIVHPASIPYPSGTMDGGAYLSWRDRVMTEEQASRVRTWQMLTIQCNAQWDVYCGFNRRGPGAEAAYAEWKRIYELREDAHIEMTRVFYPHD